MPKYAVKAASCHASREAASGRFGWWQVRLVAASVGAGFMQLSI